MPEQTTLARFLAIVLTVAVVCNGAGFYLKRIGWLDHDGWRDYWSWYCIDSDEGAAVSRQCKEYTSPREIAAAASGPAQSHSNAYRYAYQVTAAERPLKLVKDFLWLLLIGFSAHALSRRWTRLPAPRVALPIYLFSGYALALLAISIPINGALVAAAGVLAMIFLVVPLCGRWLLRHLDLFAKCLAILLVIEALLIPLEMVRGIHLFRGWGWLSLTSRAAGTLAQPSSLGVFAVAAMAFYYCFSKTRRALIPLSAVTLSLVALSGSAMAMTCAALLLFVSLWQTVPSARASRFVGVSALLLLALVVLMLPLATGRPELYNSLGSSGRLAVLQSALLDRGPLEVAFGSGLGVNTNLALNLASFGAHAAQASGAAMQPTDSTFTGLLIQVGVVGTLLFYVMLALAALRDAHARPFFAVAALSSLSTNITELFPVNLLLGLALAHSTCVDPQSEIALNAKG